MKGLLQLFRCHSEPMGRQLGGSGESLWSLCLQVIVEANQGMVAPELEKTYYLYFETKNEKWKEDIVMAMLQLNYNKPYELYNSFIDYHLKNETGRAFFLMVQYCRVDFLRGSELLSNYYANNLLSKDSHEYNNQHHIGYLIHWLINSPSDCLHGIIKQTGAKNKVAGNYLKQATLSFLSSGQSSDLKIGQVKECIRTINEFTI